MIARPALNSATAFRPPETPTGAAPALESLLDEFERRWRGGEQPRTEEYLKRYPKLSEQPEAVIELLYEEICQRRQAGETISEQQLAARFPQWQKQLEMLFDCQRLLGETAEVAKFPAVGERLGDFVFLAELGRGAHGRVFLAAQASLANRPVVLKLAPPRGSEHLCLARLQHTHIVPLYFVADFSDRALRGICLPYFGGATLARVLESLAPRARAQRKATEIVTVIQRSTDESPLLASDSPLQNASPALKFLERASYEQAICWMGACLAEALNEAHARGLVHLDLKPSNVLWAGDGQPMLLDFHLAQAPIAAGAEAPDWLGGTPGYMPPEQQAALEAVRRNTRIESAVDGRADIYALGRVMSEALAGKLPPADAAAGPWLRAANPLVSIGLADLIAKCLAPAPEDRYENAAALAADLRRHLSDLPLVAVNNRSWTERWCKWRRRRPHALLVFLLAVAAAGAGLLVATQLRKQFSQAEIALEEGRKLIEARRFAEARSTLRQGLNLIAAIYGGSELTRQLEAEMRVADRAYASNELHEFVERTRVLCSAEGLRVDELRQLELRSHDFWDRRWRIIDRDAPPAPGEAARRLRSDLLDLAILWGGIRLKLAVADQIDTVHHDCLEILAEAEALAGSSCVVHYARQAHAAALGMDDLARQSQQAAEAMPPQNAWEYAAAGHALWEARKLDLAYPLFEEAIRQEPQSLWANFCLGRCAYELGRYADSASAFTACVALAPSSAWCYHNRGLAMRQLGRDEHARSDFDRALSLDPALAAAAMSRGRLNLQEHRWEEALADFRAALERGAESAGALLGRAAAEEGQGDVAAARDSLKKALQLAPDHPEARALQLRLNPAE